MRALSEDAGVSQTTLERWSKKDSWPEQRRQYQGRLTAKTEEKTIEKTSEILSDEMSKITTEHFECYRIFRKLAYLQAKALFDRCDRHRHPEALEEVLKEMNPLALNGWSLVLDRSIKGERTALGIGVVQEDIEKFLQSELDFTRLTVEELQDLRELMGKAKKEAVT